ncbi:sulfotransferase [Lewinella sp. IMCC34183]|uniref:sulfotransferase n=1 Tax=Lewinella sp. IMCC34183 TaxID=2248762 RepID=UPI000E274AE2|nr:sulfotransferase [Lewinella sp. IMCC34183]
MRITSEQTFNHPDFLVVGAAKSGTTSLHRYLTQHPQLYLPDVKETWFYHSYDNPNQSIHTLHPGLLPRNLPAYLALFEDASPQQRCGEITPSYLQFPVRTIRNIQRFHPRWQDLRIVMILREPIEKLLSHYQYVHRRNLDPEGLNLYDSLKREPERRADPAMPTDVFYLQNSLYAVAVEAYQTAFEHVRIYLYDDFKADPNAVLHDLQGFLGVDPIALETTKSYNRSSPRRLSRHPLLAQATRQLRPLKQVLPRPLIDRLKALTTRPEGIDPRAIAFLKPLARADVLRLEKLLDRDLGHWLRRYETEGYYQPAD